MGLRSAHTRRLLAGLVLAVLLLAFFFRSVRWGDLARAFRDAHLVYLLPLLLCTFLAYVIRSWRWGFLLAPLARIPLARLLAVTLMGFASAFVIPRAGEVLRPYLVARSHQLRTSAAFASIILERLVDLATVLALFALYLFVLPAPSSQVGAGATLDMLKGAGAVAAATTLAVGIGLWLFHAHADRFFVFLERWLAHMPRRLAEAVSHILRSFRDGLAVLEAPGAHLLAVVAQSLLLWLAIALGFYFNNLAFGIHLPYHSTFLLIAFLTVGVAIPTPGMVGGFHAFYLLALTQVYGVDPGTAAAAGLSAHAVSNIPVVLLGFPLLGREGLTLGRVAAMADSGAPQTSEEQEAPGAQASEKQEGKP
jgi:uncharacterized protein (TIRG00374 family)